MEPRSTSNAQACFMKPVSRDGEVGVIKDARKPGAAYTHAKQLGKQGSLEQQLQPRARLIARNDYQSELRLATILAMSETDAKPAAAAKHFSNIEGKFKKPAEPHRQSTSRTSSDPGQFTPTCRAQGQQHLEEAGSSSNADAFEWQDIDLTEDGDDSDVQIVALTESTVCTASLQERGEGDTGHLRARAQPGSIVGVTQGATGQKKPQAVRGWLLKAKTQPSAMLSVTQAAARQKETQAVQEKFYNHHLPTEGVEEMLSVFSEEDT